MSVKTKILIVEHDPTDLELIQYELKKGGIDYVSEIVQNEQDYVNALNNFIPDIILSDYSLPSFDGLTAFEMRERLAPNTPFIFVSGTIGEENSIEFIKNGVTDYALKDKLFTLTTKVKRALKESKEKQQKNEIEQERKQGESRLKEAQTIAHVGSWEIDMVLNIHHWSDELFSIFGTKRGEVLPSTELLLSFIHPDDLDIVMKKNENAYKTLGDSSFDFRFIRKDGALRYGYCRYRFETDHDRRPLRLSGIVQDITEKKLAEEALLKSETNLRTIFENSDTGYVLLNAQLTILSFNEPASQWIFSEGGLPLREGIDFLSCQSVQRKGLVNEMMKEVLSGGYIEYEVHIPEVDPFKWYFVHLRSIKNEVGKVFGVCINVSNITELKKAENKGRKAELELHAAHERLLFHIENTPLGFIEWDDQLLVKSWSKRAEEIFGWTEKEFVDAQKTGYSQEFDEDLAWVSEIATQLITGNVERNRVQHRHNTKDGRVIWCEWFNSVLKDKKGKVITIMSLVQDITEQKTTEAVQREKLEGLVEGRTRELNEALKKEKELVEMKNKFVSIASHEFRTPLSTISFAAESIRNYFHQLTAEEIERKLIKIEDQASHMTNLLEDILTLGKSEAGKIKVKRISLSLKEFFDSLIEEVRSTVKERREINFTFSCANNKINADDKLLRNVVNNLLTNALKFSAADTPVAIAVSDFKGGILIEVTDEGIGIEESELKSIFESFQRGSNASAVQGTGLGLSILKKAVELMDGSIDVKSSLSKGSTFSVQIPTR